MELKDTLKILRKELGCTQAELANALHVSELSVTRWESGKTAPRTNSAQALLQLAENKGVSKLCRDRLREALQKGREQMLKVPESPLFPVERESICQLVDDCVNAVYVADSKTDELLYVNHMAEKAREKILCPARDKSAMSIYSTGRPLAFSAQRGR